MKAAWLFRNSRPNTKTTRTQGARALALLQQYHEKVRLAFHKQQQAIDSLLQLVHDMSGRLKGLEDRAERSSFTSGPGLPAAPATAELVERVMTLREAMEEVKPMDRPLESAPYTPPRVDPRLLRSVPMSSKSTMLGDGAPPMGPCRKSTC